MAKGGKQEKPKWKQMKWSTSSAWQARRSANDPMTPTNSPSQPVDRPTVKYGNVSAGFGLANLLQRITNAHAKPSHWLTAMAYSKVACECVFLTLYVFVPHANEP